MADKFEDLRTLVTVIDSGGVVAASEMLGIAKSAVSRRLAELEIRIGATLVERTTRKFEPTAAGLAYYAEAKRILAAVAALEAGFGSDDGSSIGVSVSVRPGMLAHLLFDGISTFRDRRPDAVVSVGPTRSSGEADAWVRLADGAAPRRSDERTVAWTRQLLCAAPSYLQSKGTPATPADLVDHEAVVIGETSATSWGLAAGLTATPHAILSVADEQTALSAAVAGVGIVQLPDFLAAPAIEVMRLVTVLDGYAPDAVEVVAGCGATAAAVVAQLVDHLAAGRSGTGHV